jgi:transposase
MRFAGIDVGSQTHVVAIVGEGGDVLVKPTSFGEDAAGYEKLFTLLGSSEEELLIAMEATGHYGWKLSARLRAKSIKVALL